MSKINVIMPLVKLSNNLIIFEANTYIYRSINKQNINNRILIRILNLRIIFIAKNIALAKIRIRGTSLSFDYRALDFQYWQCMLEYDQRNRSSSVQEVKASRQIHNVEEIRGSTRDSIASKIT